MSDEEEKKENSLLFDIIDAYNAGEKVRDVVTTTLSGEYNKLRDYVIEFERLSVDEDPEILDAFLLSEETSWLETKYEKVEPYIHKNGSWKYRTLLPKSYSSAKSVVLKGKELGILNHSLGKSALEKLIKEKLRESIIHTPLTSQELVVNMLSHALTHLSSAVGTDKPLAEYALRCLDDLSEQMREIIDGVVRIKPFTYTTSDTVGICDITEEDLI